MKKGMINKNNPRISVIICAYTMERLRDIHEAIGSVMAQTLKPYELIVAVDHNEELFQRLKTELPPEVNLVLSEGVQGLSETRNVGIRAATGDIIAFIDDDAIAEEDWLKNLAQPFRDPRVVAVGGRAVPLWMNGKRPFWFPEELDWIVGCTYRGLPLSGNEIRNVPGCNMAFRSEAIKEAGLWENMIGSIGQSLKGGEEAELCLRIKGEIQSALIFWEPCAVIYHKVPPSRTSLKWIMKDSFDQGSCKARVKKFSKNISQEPLSTENSYLRYLFFTSIPERLRRFYKKDELPQVAAIMVCIAATGVGYFVGVVGRAKAAR